MWLFGYLENLCKSMAKNPISALSKGNGEGTGMC
jgi:hypothetical protein